jgi:hypothetical protein
VKQFTDCEDEHVMKLQGKPKNKKRSSKRSKIDNDQDKADEALSMKKGRRRTVKVAWSQEELELLLRHFSNFMKSDSLPGFALIKQIQKRYPILAKRTPAQVKARFFQLRQMQKKCG